LKRTLAIFLQLFLSTQVFCQNEPFVLSGKLLDKQNLNPIENFNITNKTRKRYTYSNHLGLFQIACNKNDTLIVNGIGFLPKTIIVNDAILLQKDFLIIMLEAEIYELKEVTINNLGTYNDFKKNFLTIQPKKELIINLGLPNVKPGIPKLLDDNYVKSVGFAMKSPISFFYYNLNEKEKSKRKIFKLIYEAPITFEIEKKFNRDKVALWTGLKDFELNEFIVFCNFDRNYLLMVKDYEIIIKTQEKLKEFKQKKKDEHKI